MSNLPSDLTIAIAAHAPVYSVYNMRSCCSVFRLQYNDALGKVSKDMYSRYFRLESSIDVLLSSCEVLARRVRALLFGAYLAMVRRENDTSFSFFACNAKARCVNELFLLPYDVAPTTMTTLRQVGLTLIAVHATRGKQDLAFLCIKDALHDEYVSSAGWKIKKQRQLQDRFQTERALLLYRNYIHRARLSGRGALGYTNALGYRNDIYEVWYRLKSDSSFRGLLKEYEEHMGILRDMRP